MSLRQIGTAVSGASQKLFNLISRALVNVGNQSEAIPGPRATPALNLILMNLCGHDQERTLYVLQWLALAYRHPHAKMPQALLFQGGQGTGKYLYFRQLIAPLFEARAAVIEPQRLSAPIGDWIHGKKLVVVEEANCIDQDQAATLKHLMSSDTVRAHRRGLPPQWVRSRASFVLLASDKVAHGPDERRLAVFDVPPPLHPEIYAIAADEIANGAQLVFRNYLLRGLDVTGLAVAPTEFPDVRRAA